LRNFLKNNFLLLLLYFLLIGTAVYFILNFERNNIHLFVNQYVGNRYVNAFFYYITYLGDGRFAAAILAIIMVSNVRLGLCATFAFLASALLSNGLKYFFFDDVNRPFFIFQYIDKYDLKLVEGVDMYIHNSFPSGHATQGFAILMCVAFAARPQFVKIFLLALAILTSFSRVYLSQHFLADITAGSFVGFCCAFLFFYLMVARNKFTSLDKTLPELRRR
jgi:membrane-associated phospholipid phosphatase